MKMMSRTKYKIIIWDFVHWYYWYVQPQFRDPITVINMLPLQSYLMSGTLVTGLHRTGLGVTCCLTVVTIGFVGNIKPKVIINPFHWISWHFNDKRNNDRVDIQMYFLRSRTGQLWTFTSYAVSSSSSFLLQNSLSPILLKCK